MITYTTVQKKKKLVNLIFMSLFILGLIVYSVPVFAELYAFPFVVASLIMFVAGIFILLRYTMTTFSYNIRISSDVDGDPDALAETYSDIRTAPESFLDLVVYKAQGSREGAMECVLSVADLIEVHEIGKGCESKRDIVKKYAKDSFSYYDYTLTFMPDTVLEFIFNDGDKPVGIILEKDNPVSDFLLTKCGK